MNILIVGNGFDLSHYLPTKYDHFMDVMKNIEEFTGSQMAFDDLFRNCREDWFIAKTKKYYMTENITFEKEELTEIKKLLEENCWYLFFKHHVKEVKTWIDLESKISEALKCICKFLNKIDDVFERFGDRNLEIYFLDKASKKEDHNFYMSELDSDQLMLLKLINKNSNYGKTEDFWIDKKLADIYTGWFISSEKTSYGFSKQNYLDFLTIQLDKFIDLFNFYLELIVSQLEPRNLIYIDRDNSISPNKIFSFNYTNTYHRLHSEVSTEYLHGRHGNNQNIVLGISDLEDDSLKSLKAYGFTKYHQKLFKDTDYQFFSGNQYLKQTQKFWDQVNNSNKVFTQADQDRFEANIFIWGHSLDISDENYMNEIFSYNHKHDEHVRVTIYYFNASAKFELLANLIHILGKDKVEQWMKNGWLKFEENPKINFGV